MTVTYNTATINTRLTDVVTALGSSGLLQILDSANNVLSTMPLSNPAGTVAGGVLTLSGLPLADGAAAATGIPAFARLTTGAGTVIISALTVSSAGGGGDIVLNPNSIQAGQTLALTAGQIQGR